MAVKNSKLETLVGKGILLVPAIMRYLMYYNSYGDCSRAADLFSPGYPSRREPDCRYWITHRPKPGAPEA